MPKQDKAFRTYVTKEGKFVGQGMTDGGAFWLVDTNGDLLSEFLCNRAQVTMSARRLFGRLVSWNPLVYGHPSWDNVSADEK